MKEKVLSEKDFKSLVKLAYEEYFSELLKEPIACRFFKNRDPQKLKEKEINGINRFYSMFINNNLSILKEELTELGKLHYNLQIEFSFFLEKLNRLELIFVKKMFLLQKNPEDKFPFISKFFDTIRDYVAKGYMLEHIKREHNIIRTYIEQSLGEKFINIKSIIEKHIVWEENILKYLSTDIMEKEIQLDSSKCEMGKWLENLKSKDTESVIRLKNLHDELHLIAENIIAFKKLDKYTLLLDEYNQFIKQNLLFMSSLITFLFNEEIEELQRDPLTDLLTRRTLEEIFVNVLDISMITGEPFGVAFIDIDNFKKINDTYGHDAGDVVLKKVAEVLRNTLRRSDYIFRYGGEEFVIIVPATTKDAFYKVLEKIRKRINQTPIKINGNQINVSVSIGGVVIYTKHVLPLSKVIKMADSLMYKAKKAGKNRVFVEVLNKVI